MHGGELQLLLPLLLLPLLLLLPKCRNTSVCSHLSPDVSTSSPGRAICVPASLTVCALLAAQ
jgi:hypothetical protein